MSQRIETAYHEAGHAVAYWVQGITPLRVAVSPDGEGVVTIRIRISDEPRLRKQQIIATFAGPMAEGMGSDGDTRSCLDDESAAADWDAIETLSAGLSDRTNKRLFLAAEAMVRAHWATIERVAVALIAHEDLDGEALTRLCSAAA